MVETLPPTNQVGAEPVNSEVRFEKSDAYVGGVIWFGTGMIVAGVVVHLVLSGMFSSLQQREDSARPPLNPAIEKLRQREREDLIPPRNQDAPRDYSRLDRDGEWRPLLQTDPAKDMAALREEEERDLNGYAWVDRKAGVVRIPINRAMQMLTDPGFARGQGIKIRPRSEAAKQGERP